MKKLICIAMAGVLMMSLTACGSKEETATEETTENTEAAPACSRTWHGSRRPPRNPTAAPPAPHGACRSRDREVP